MAPAVGGRVGAAVGGKVDPVAMDQVIGVSTSITWVANLLIVQWWLDRHPRPAEPAG